MVLSVNDRHLNKYLFSLVFLTVKIELPNVLIVDKTRLRATGQSQATEINIFLAYETISPVIALMHTPKTNIYQT